MKDEVRWGDLRPILQDMADRIGRVEQFLAASGMQGSAATFQAPVFDSPGQVAAQARGIYPGDMPDDGVPDNIVMLARSGQLVQAIQQYRQLTGIGLKEAKAIVEQVAARGY